MFLTLCVPVEGPLIKGVVLTLQEMALLVAVDFDYTQRFSLGFTDFESSSTISDRCRTARLLWTALFIGI